MTDTTDSTVAALAAFTATYGTEEVELAEWELPYLVYFVALETGERFVARCDNRDLRKAEETLGGTEKARGAAMMFSTATAWAALRRTGQTGLSWPAFSAVCVAVAAQERSETVDPTSTGGAP
jgi:hypothetical protein